MQKILGHLRRADNDYNMICDGDKIAVGLSGGKDSLTLVAALKRYQGFGTKKFDFVAVSVDNRDGDTDFSGVSAFCEKLGVEHHIVKSQIFEVVFKIRKEKSPCSLCAKMRRGILNAKAKELGCNKIALGHHADDVIETFFLSLLYEGRLSTMKGKSYMDRTDITLIRPLIYVPESETTRVSRTFPVINNCCALNGKTQRAAMKGLVKKLDGEISGARKRINDAINYLTFDNIKCQN